MTARVALGALIVGMLAMLVWLGVGTITANAPTALAAQTDSHAQTDSRASTDSGESGASRGSPASAAAAAAAAAAPAPVAPPAVPGDPSNDAPARGAVTAPSHPSAALAMVSAPWAESIAHETGIPSRAVVAYAAAALRLQIEQPSCGVGWNTLAAIGGIESGHATHGGSTIASDGRVTPAIYGPRLDGGEFAAISDSDGGALDADSGADRAVGPLQFIPQTWSEWGSDADGDGTADPQQIDDAALSAGRYLCHYGSLIEPAAWRSAVFAYNHLDSYVDAVAAAANEYAAQASTAAQPAPGTHG